MKKINIRIGEAGQIDYVQIVDANNLEEVKNVQSGDVIVLAVNLGKTRLIDNMII